RYGHDRAGNDVAQLGTCAAIDRAGGQMKQEVDEARRLVLAAEQAAKELLDLRSDAGQVRNRREQRIEQVWSHRPGARDGRGHAGANAAAKQCARDAPASMPGGRNRLRKSEYPSRVDLGLDAPELVEIFAV